MDAPQRPPRPAPPPPAPRRSPPGPPPGSNTGDVLQQIMAMTDQSLDEAQARCWRGFGGGPSKVASLKGAGRGARTGAAGVVGVRKVQGERCDESLGGEREGRAHGRGRLEED